MFLSVFYGFVLTAAALLPGHCVAPQADGGDFVEFSSAPDHVESGSSVLVRFRCSRPCQLTVAVVTSTLTVTDLVVFRRKWTWKGGALGVFRTRSTELRFPPSILYRQSFFNRHVLDSHNATLRAWLDQDGATRSYHDAVDRVHKVLQVQTPSERPVRPPTQTPAWSALMVWTRTRTRIQRCPHQSVVVDVLAFPLASPSQNSGVVRRFQPFTHRGLETTRLQAVTRPRVSWSVWIYLLDRCRQRLCSVLQHVDRKQTYDSLLMQITDTGDVVIQGRVTTGEDEAFRAPVTLPRWKWIRLDVYVRESKALLDAMWDGERRRFEYQFGNNLRYDDTDGHFLIGGSRFNPGFHGYIGSIKYYRLGTEQINHERRHESTLQQLEETHRECREMQTFTESFLQEMIKSHFLSQNYAGSSRWPWRPSPRGTCTQWWTWAEQQKHNDLFHFLQSKQEVITTGSLDLPDVLFEQAVDVAFTDSRDLVTSSSLLRAASCFGSQKASLLLAAAGLSNLSDAVDRRKGLVYSLIGAAADDRFALMHAGYKHMQGIDGFPKDLDVAYSYYANAVSQSDANGDSDHEDEVHPVEHVYLNNQDDVNGVELESDVFHFTKYQAESGDVESQKRLAAMLYWGQNGVAKNLASAAKWFERSALQTNDPNAMYDYAILLMKGEGVERNATRGFLLLEKAAALGSINALNGLGWYHGTVLNDHETAARFFEQAARNGSDDAMFNLGIYHVRGIHPDGPRPNETAAFLQFLNASRLGHIAASVEVARFLSTGSLDVVTQDVERAVILLKTVCEQDGRLGFLMRAALQANLRGARWRALVTYVLAAEAGLGLAQSNAAHLCQELNLGAECRQRYQNFSVWNHDPHPSALLTAGDVLYRRSSPDAAAAMYVRAAAAGSPQAMFNLAVLLLDGNVLPQNVYETFNVTQRGVEEILKRCVETEDSEDAVTPCSLFLLAVRLLSVWTAMNQNAALLLLVWTTFVSAAAVLIVLSLQSVFDHRGTGPNGVRRGTAALRDRLDATFSVSGVFLCVFWTAVLYHFL